MGSTLVPPKTLCRRRKRITELIETFSRHNGNRNRNRNGKGYPIREKGNDMALRITKPMNLGVLYRPFENDRAYYFPITVFAHFGNDPHAPFLSEMAMWEFTMSLLGEPPILDMGMPKTVGEVLVYGSAYAPPGERLPARKIRLEMDTIRKELLVFGDRYWLSGTTRHTDPVPFSMMPVQWNTAFGFPEYPKNPWGKGGVPVTMEDGQTMHPLPNVEYPDHLLTSPKQQPDPASFSPWFVTHPDRTALQGTYDDAWRANRFPGFPADFDWSFHNAAPPDQRLPRYLHPGETYRVLGMHPERETVEGTVPHMTCRCFLLETGEDGAERFREVELRMDTLLLFPHAERGVAVWRGMVQVRHEDFRELKELVLGYERVADTPRPMSHYRAALDAFLAPQSSEAFLRAEEMLIPEGHTGPMRALVEDPALKKALLGDQIQMERQREEQARQQEAFIQQMKSIGVDPTPYLQQVPDTDALLADPDTDAAVREGQERIRMMQAQADAIAKKAKEEYGIDLPPLPDPFDLPRPPAGERAESMIEKTRAGLLPLMPEANKEDFESMLAGMEGLQQQQPPMAAHHMNAPHAVDEETNARVRAMLEDAKRDGTSMEMRCFAGCDLSGMDLAGMDFTGADFAGAILKGTQLRGATLQRCSFAYAVLEEADLTGADAETSNFSKSRLDRAILRDLKATRAFWEEAEGEGTDLSGAVLAEANLTKAQIRGGTFAGASFRDTIFMGADFPGTSFADAKMDGQVFMECEFEGADFSRVQGDDLTFAMCRMRGMRFDGAHIPKFYAAPDTDLSGAIFAGADMESTSLIEVNLEGADFSGANLAGCTFAYDPMQGARLRGTHAPGTSFRYCDMEGADLSSLNLKEGSLHGARLSGASLRDANLYAADLMKATLGNTNLEGAILHKTILRTWQPKGGGA